MSEDVVMCCPGCKADLEERVDEFVTIHYCPNCQPGAATDQARLFDALAVIVLVATVVTSPLWRPLLWLSGVRAG